jgi:ABC-type phosphate/phosphonate transport system substrate-binding protein
LQFSGFVETGSHAGSLAALVEGRADFAYIDAVTWRLLKRFDPNAKQVHLLGQSIASPALPLICALDQDVAALRATIRDAVVSFSTQALEGQEQDMGGRLSWSVLDEALYFAHPRPAPPPDLTT